MNVVSPEHKRYEKYLRFRTKVKIESLINFEIDCYEWTLTHWIKTPCRQVIPIDYEQKSMLDQIANLLEQVRTAHT